MSNTEETIALPIEPILPELIELLSRENRVILQAEPGAGKTTRVPLACLSLPSVAAKKIVMLEPRRLAARNAARYLASIIDEEVGSTVGYSIRGEKKVSAATRIEVVTEGVLTRLLQEDPALSEIGLVIFDEFHERSIHADTGLAFCLESQESLRPDLKLLIMSATLDLESLAALLDQAPIVRCPGRSFPVRLEYLGDSDQPLPPRIVQAARRAAKNDPGDILVFLPGRREIARVLEEFTRRESEFVEKILVLPLSSEQNDADQRLALSPAAPSVRKIILATSIAETSLTIPGVGIVIDSGFSRVPAYDSQRAMASLVTVPVTQAASEQRRGRAGRLGPGVCYRLWSKERQKTLLPFQQPEILNTDLVPLALELALWGCADPSKLKFFDQPPAATLQRSQEVLRDLQILDHQLRVTAHGKDIAKLGVHPRLAHLLLRAKALEIGSIGCDLVALLEERDLLRGQNHDVDMYSRWLILNQFRKTRDTSGCSPASLFRIELQSKRLAKTLQISTPLPNQSNSPNRSENASIGLLIAFAYPERIALRRGEGMMRYLLRNGVGAELPRHSLINRYDYLAIAELGGATAHARVFLAEELTEKDLRSYFGSFIEKRREVSWSEDTDSIVVCERENLGAIIVTEKRVLPRENEVAEAFLEAVRQSQLELLPWTEDATSLRRRFEWLRLKNLLSQHPTTKESSYEVPRQWPNFSTTYLSDTLEEWLLPFLQGKNCKSDLRQLDLYEILQGQLSWEQRKIIDQLAPVSFELPTGTRAKINYEVDPPKISIRLQECYGRTTTPEIAQGKVPLTLELLSPAGRPLQVTRDLVSFWQNAYREVRKEMLSRYPKHFWPEDPLAAAPTRKSKAGMKREQEKGGADGS